VIDYRKVARAAAAFILCAASACAASATWT